MYHFFSLLATSIIITFCQFKQVTKVELELSMKMLKKLLID